MNSWEGRWEIRQVASCRGRTAGAGSALGVLCPDQPPRQRPLRVSGQPGAPEAALAGDPGGGWGWGSEESCSET